MNPLRSPLRAVLFAAVLAGAARADDAGYAITDAECIDPPTAARLADVEAVAASSGWLAVAAPLRSAALRAYRQDRLAAADAWFNDFRWAALFCEPEDDFTRIWTKTLEGDHLNYEGAIGRYIPSDKPLGNYLSSEMQAWLLAHPPFSEEFFSTLKPVDNLPMVFSILEGLHRRDPVKFERYASLALAFAVVDDVPPPSYWPHHQVSAQALSRTLANPAASFDWLTSEDAAGRTYFRLSRLRAEELKFVVDAAAPVAELRWSQTAVTFPLDELEGAYKMVGYRTDRSTSNKAMVWSGRPYTLQAILKQGGICIDQAYFATEAGKARGVPTMIFMGAGQDGRHAWFGYLDSRQKWRLDAGRYAEQRLVTGAAFDPQTWGEISDHELQFLTERFRALPSFMQSRVHEEFARDFLQAGYPEEAAKSARMAVNFEHRNLPAWEVLIAANSQGGMDPRKQEGVMREASLAFARYPDLVVWYVNRVCQSLRARGETSLANFEERGLAERLQGDRSDLAVKQASGILSRSIGSQAIPDQIATYNAILVQFGRGAGTRFFDEIVTGFAEHLAQANMKPQARDAVERARVVLEIQPGTQVATDMDKLMSTLAD